MVPPPSTRVTIPSSWIKSFRLNGPPSKYRFFLPQTLSSIFRVQSKPHFKGLLRNPSFHTIDITHATGVILSFYSPYVNKPRDYFAQGFSTLSPNPDKPEKQNLYHESTKVRKLEKETIKFRVFHISCFRD